MREIITFECTKCRERNYTATKNKKKHKEKISLSKFCNSCRIHTAHKEIK